MKLRSLLPSSGKYAPLMPRAAHQNGVEKMKLHVGNFPPFSLNLFKCSGVIAADMGLEIEWAGLPFGLWS